MQCLMDGAASTFHSLDLTLHCCLYELFILRRTV